MPKLDPSKPDQSETDLFLEVGRLLFEGDDWQSRYAAALGIPKTRIRNISRGAADTGRDGALLHAALALAERRAKDTLKARDALRAWGKRQKG